MEKSADRNGQDKILTTLETVQQENSNAVLLIYERTIEELSF